MTEPILPDTAQLDYHKSKQLAELLNARTKQCYYNSIMATICHLDDHADDQLAYVEGVAISPMGIPMEHGWVKAGDAILDPTWVIIHDAETMATVRYFPATQYNRDAIREALGKAVNSRHNLRLPLFIWTPGTSEATYSDPHIAAATEAAYRFVFGNGVMDTLGRMMEMRMITPIS